MATNNYMPMGRNPRSGGAGQAASYKKGGMIKTKKHQGGGSNTLDPTKAINKFKKNTSMQKGGTAEVAGVMKSGGTAKSVKPVKKYQKAGGGPGKGLFEQIKSTQEAIKKTPSSAGPREQENYRLILKEREKMKNRGAMYPIDRGIEKSVFFNSLEDADRANEVDDLMLKNARKFSPGSKKTGGAKYQSKGAVTAVKAGAVAAAKAAMKASAARPMMKKIAKIKR